jgi:hypothetical protein
MAAHHADLNQIEIAARLRLQESPPTAEMRRIARDRAPPSFTLGFCPFLVISFGWISKSI